MNFTSHILECEIDLKKILLNENKFLDLLKIKKTDLDINYCAEYLFLNSFDKDALVIYFIFQKEKEFWVNIFYKSRIRLKNYNLGEYYDIETPYGYGGPISNSKSIKFLNLARINFDNWCQKKNIVCELIRFNPFLKNNHNISNKNNIDIICIKKLALVKNVDEISLNFFDQKTRNMIKKNFHSNINFQVYDKSSINDDLLLKFYENYTNSMSIKKAEKFYFFPWSYFLNLKKLILKDNALLVMANNIINKDYLCGAIFLKNNNNCYYHLSFKKKFAGLMNSLLFFFYSQSKKKNIKNIMLGGGLTNDENDSLFKFKEKMSNISVDFYIGTKIHNQKIYNRIVEYFKLTSIPSKLLFYKYND